MFHFDPNLQQLSAPPGSVVYVAESSNQPNVAVPGRQAQAAQAIVVGLRSGHSVSVFVSLYLAQERVPAIFVHERRRVPLTALDRAVEDAWVFCESMGFILDVQPFGSMSRVEQERLFARLRPGEASDTNAPVVPEPPAALTPGPTTPVAAPTPSPAELARLGRLLASF